MNSTNDIHTLLNKAWSKRNSEDFIAAKKLLDTAIKKCDKIDFESLGQINHIYMQIAFDQQLYEQALRYSKASVDYHVKTKNQAKIAHSIRHLADIQVQLGQLDEAESNYAKSINLYRQEPSTSSLSLANALRSFAILLEKKGEISAAIDTWEETKVLYQQSGIGEGVQEAEAKLNSFK